MATRRGNSGGIWVDTSSRGVVAAPVSILPNAHKWSLNNDWGPFDSTTFDSTTFDNNKEKTLQLFEYVVIYAPRDDKGTPISASAKVITGVSQHFARTEEAVRLHAIQEIATQSDLDLDFVQVIVRPFARS